MRVYALMRHGYLRNLREIKRSHKHNHKALKISYLCQTYITLIFSPGDALLTTHLGAAPNVAVFFFLNNNRVVSTLSEGI